MIGNLSNELHSVLLTLCGTNARGRHDALSLSILVLLSANGDAMQFLILAEKLHINFKNALRQRVYCLTTADSYKHNFE